ncbi:MAG: hypothetical protein JKY65_24365 [Planctomycetes bacterium]|nr:hypothetical protein [Planctomycetota bacterium]
MALLNRSSALLTTSTARGRDLPRAAVEIIARLSAERGRLRDEVARLRSELRQAPQPETLARLRAERDALARQLADAHQRLSTQTTSGAFQSLQGRQVEALGKLAERLERGLAGLGARASSFDRLERAVTRLERVGSGPAPRVETRVQQRPELVESPARTTRAMPRAGGGMLAKMLRENVALREDSEPTRTRAAGPQRPQPAASRPQSQAPARQPVSRSPRPGGGFMSTLVNQNLGLRRCGTTNH